jgi:hypothetical protein
MAVTKVYYRHRNMTYRIHGENKKLQENYLRQRALILAQNIRQLEDEKNAVAARLHRLTPQVRAEFLRMRLHAIEQRMKEENTGY